LFENKDKKKSIFEDINKNKPLPPLPIPEEKDKNKYLPPLPLGVHLGEKKLNYSKSIIDISNLTSEKKPLPINELIEEDLKVIC